MSVSGNQHHTTAEAFGIGIIRKGIGQSCESIRTKTCFLCGQNGETRVLTVRCILSVKTGNCSKQCQLKQ